MTSNVPVTIVRAPVSILERLVPSVAFAIASMSGAIGAMLLEDLIAAIRSAETTGLNSLFAGLSRVNAVISGILMLSAAVGGIGLIFCVVRMFTTNRKATPPGILLLLMGCLSLIPSLILGIGVYLVILSVSGPLTAGINTIAWIVRILDIAAIAVTCLMIVVLGAFSFVGFSSRIGRKYSPFILFCVIEIAIIAAAAIFFSVVQFSNTHTNTPFRL